MYFRILILINLIILPVLISSRKLEEKMDENDKVVCDGSMESCVTIEVDDPKDHTDSENTERVVDIFSSLLIQTDMFLKATEEEKVEILKNMQFIVKQIKEGKKLYTKEEKVIENLAHLLKNENTEEVIDTLEYLLLDKKLYG